MKKIILGITLVSLLMCVSAWIGDFQPVIGELGCSWIRVRDTVTGAYGEAVVGSGDAIYIARKSSFYRYNVSDNSWTPPAAPPNPDSGDAFKAGTVLA